MWAEFRVPEESPLAKVGNASSRNTEVTPKRANVRIADNPLGTAKIAANGIDE